MPAIKKMDKLSEKKQKMMEFMDKTAPERDSWINRNKYYYKNLTKLFRFIIPEGSDVLEIGCGTGAILNSVNPKKGVGIDISSKMIEIAKNKYKHLQFFQADAEKITIDEKFDYIIISDTLGYLEDIQNAFKELWKVSRPDTRIIITYHNFLWQPLLKFAEFFRLKMPQIRLNWVNEHDIYNLLELEGFEAINRGKRFLFPKYLPLISWLHNKYIANLPIINSLCITGYIVARQRTEVCDTDRKYSVSVVIPVRNEKGNIENAVKRMPKIGNQTEIIFVEGHSTDNTIEELKRVCAKYKKNLDVKYYIQDGKGKGDAVRKGFSSAKGEILMILDADLTVPPEELSKFYNALASGKGEFINGSRLVYPLEKDSMRYLNILGNKFFAIMFSWILGQRLKDTLCGTKVIFKRHYEKLIRNRKYFGDFDPFGDFDLIFGAAKLNLKIIEIPVRYQAREYGQTNISRFKHGWLLLKMTLFAIKKIKFL